MKQVTFRMTGISPYSQSKLISAKKERETAKDHESRCWMERAHIDASGGVIIPPMAVKNALSECAKFMGMQIPGKGKSTYTKHFEAGLMCMDPVVLHRVKGKAEVPLSIEDIKPEWLFVPSDGKRGGGKRVEKCFPKIETGWTGVAKITVVDPMITEEVLKLHLTRAGQFIGIGRFRPRNNGFYGRFTVSEIEWKTISDDI
jgi:hypothetical protein